MKQRWLLLVILFDKYQQKAWSNLKLKLAINAEQSNNNRDNISTIDVLEEISLSSTINTDEDNDNDE